MFVILPRKLLLHEIKHIRSANLGFIHLNLLHFSQDIHGALACTTAHQSATNHIPTAYTASHVLHLETLKLHTLDAGDLRAWNVRHARSAASATYMLPHSLLEIGGILVDTLQHE